MIVSHRAHQLGMAGWLSLRDHFAFAMMSDILCVLGGEWDGVVVCSGNEALALMLKSKHPKLQALILLLESV